MLSQLAKNIIATILQVYIMSRGVGRGGQGRGIKLKPETSRPQKYIITMSGWIDSQDIYQHAALM